MSFERWESRLYDAVHDKEFEGEEDESTGPENNHQRSPRYRGIRKEYETDYFTIRWVASESKESP